MRFGLVPELETPYVLTTHRHRMRYLVEHPGTSPFQAAAASPSLRSFILGVLIVLLIGDDAAAGNDPTTRPDSPPRVCIGYDPEADTWGVKHSERSEVESCPRDYAFFSLQVPFGPDYPPAKLRVVAGCCPLPEGTLLEDHEYHEESCPDGFIATGVKQAPRGRDVVHLLRCTRLDSTRYELGPETPGQRVEYAVEYVSALRDEVVALVKNRAVNIAPWNSLPIGIRWGLGRFDRSVWLRDFCIGVPAGSVFTAKHGKPCARHGFRSILRHDKTPLQVVPQCRSIKGPYSTHPECVP